MNQRYFEINVNPGTGRWAMRWVSLPDEEAANRIGRDLFVNYYDATRMIVSQLRAGIEIRREGIARVKRTRRADIVKHALTVEAARRKASRKVK